MKFIPEKFDMIFGQDHIISTLKSLSLGGKAIFLEGEKGTGKTSLSLILANKFSDSRYNINHINCGQTSSVEDMRNLVNDINKSSIYGLNKTYIIDEPQLLSYKAANDLLIPVENLPKNVLFIACSALSSKIEPMLIDRFIVFRTKSLDRKTSMNFIEFLCERDNLQLDKFKKVLIAEKCDGNPRKIVNAIPKIININDKKDIEYLLDVHSISDDEDILQLFKLILGNANWDKVRHSLIELLKTKSPDSIRMGILNLVGNGLLRGFGAGKETKLIHMFNILERPGIPEKAHLVSKIGEICLGERIGV